MTLVSPAVVGLAADFETVPGPFRVCWCIGFGDFSIPVYTKAECLHEKNLVPGTNTAENSSTPTETWSIDMASALSAVTTSVTSGQSRGRRVSADLTNWKLAPWLQKLGESASQPTIGAAIAKALISTEPKPDSCDQLALARSMRFAGKDEVKRLLSEGGALDAIADVIFGGLERAAVMNNEKADMVRVRKVDDRNWRVRKAALLELSLDARALVVHKDVIARRLKDPEWEVSFAAAVAVGRLPAAQLDALDYDKDALEAARQAAVDRLTDPDVYVRIAAVHALSHLEPSELASHADAIVRNLRSTDDPSFAVASARIAAMRDIGSPTTSMASQPVSPGTPVSATSTVRSRRFDLAKESILHAKPAEEWAARAAVQQARAARLAVHHGSAIVQRLATSYKSHNNLKSAHLEPIQLARHGASIVQNLEDPSAWVRKEAAKLLTKIRDPSATLSQHVPTLVADLQHREPECRRAAAEVLSKFAPEHLAPHAQPIAARAVADVDPDTRMWLVRSLGKLPSRQLAEHAPSLAKRVRKCRRRPQ